MTRSPKSGSLSGPAASGNRKGTVKDRQRDLMNSIGLLVLRLGAGGLLVMAGES